MTWRWAAALALLILVLVPDVALACPVCFDPRDENRQAFLATTAFLSLLPLGMVAGAGLWLRKRSKELDREEGADGAGEERATED
jgi:hypothetical protein